MTPAATISAGHDIQARALKPAGAGSLVRHCQQPHPRRRRYNQRGHAARALLSWRETADGEDEAV